MAFKIIADRALDFNSEEYKTYDNLNAAIQIASIMFEFYKYLYKLGFAKNHVVVLVLDSAGKEVYRAGTI